MVTLESASFFLNTLHLLVLTSFLQFLRCIGNRQAPLQSQKICKSSEAGFKPQASRTNDGHSRPLDRRDAPNFFTLFSLNVLWNLINKFLVFFPENFSAFDSFTIKDVNLKILHQY